VDILKCPLHTFKLSGWCEAIKKPVPGILSGMVYLLPHTTRTLQRWRDGEGEFGLCLRRDVAAINKMHFY
jgi:hypothetical protein